jgi:hypothetical protein
MALLGSRYDRCMWWAQVASWPNPDSPQGQERQLSCFDRFGRVGGSAPLVNMVVEQKGPATTLVNNGNGRFATAGTAPVQAAQSVTHISPVVGLPARMILPPAEGAPGTDNKATGPEFPYIWVLILAVVAFIIYKS